MLDATGSMQRLTDELERISLHSFSGQPSQEDTTDAGGWMHEGEIVSGVDDSASESQSRASQVSSKFDSAFGSQTDSESVHEHLMMNPLTLYSSAPHGSYQRTGHDSHGSRRDHHHAGSQRRRKHRKHQTIHHHGDTTPSPRSISRSHQHTSTPLSQSMRLPVKPQAVDRLRRGGSTRSNSSTDSDGSSRILALGLSREDLREISHRPHQPSPVLRKYQASPVEGRYQASPVEGRYQASPVEGRYQASPVEGRYQASPVEGRYQAGTKQRSFQASSIQRNYQASLNERRHPEVMYVSAEVHDSDTDVNSSNASTPIVQTKFHSQMFTEHDISSSTERPKEPEIFVIESHKPDVPADVSNQEQSSSNQYQANDIIQASIDNNPPITTHQQPPYQASHLLPKRYVNSNNVTTGRRIPPKRSASLLQRLRKRSRSFKTTLEKRPKRRVPVRRSLSDRITYQIKKGWIEYDKDLNFISMPSYPRPVGRMIDKKAGSVHIVQLYRPPSGRYGIYISQDGSKKGIYISRFADANAAKFYSGLISPGDEIIKVNTHPVKDRSVDYVYDMLATLDSVVFTIIPITARPDW